MAWQRRTLLVNSIIGLVILGGIGVTAAALGAASPQEPDPTTAEVRRGSVIGTVAASGEIVAPGEVALDFQTAGRVVEVLVDIGDRVSADQVLARLDTTVLREQRDVAEAAVRAAVAARNRVSQGLTANQRQLLELEREQASLQLTEARDNHARAEAQHAGALEMIDRQVEVAENQYDQARQTRDDIFDELDCDNPTNQTVSACAQARDAALQARAARNTARMDREQAQLREDQVLAQASAQLRQAQLALRIADTRLAVESAPATDADTAQASAEVARANAQLAQAERDLAHAELRASTDGIIATLELREGSVVGGASATSAIVLTDVNGREAAVRFSEADATRLSVGQPAVVTFDALPGLSVNGRVARIDPKPTVTGNLVQYGAHIEIDALPDEVRLGQTVTVEVITGQADDVLYIPATAVSTVGTRSTVLVYDGVTTTQRDIELGIRGDQYVEVSSGLAEGDRVVLPTRGSATLPDIFGPGGPPEPSTQPAGSGD